MSNNSSDTAEVENVEKNKKDEVNENFENFNKEIQDETVNIVNQYTGKKRKNFNEKKFI